MSDENMTDIESSELDVSYELSGYHFVWNSEKYRLNCQKHNVTFEEAATLFLDDDTEYLEDKEHSDYEERFIAIGFSESDSILTVCHCLRDNDSVIRIFSARKATKQERKKFVALKEGGSQ